MAIGTITKSMSPPSPHEYTSSDDLVTPASPQFDVAFMTKKVESGDKLR